MIDLQELYQIQQLAERFRHAIEDAQEAREFVNHPPLRYFPRGCCEVASDLLAEYLRENGIDTYAHIGALKAHGKTIAVLPKSLDKIYPLNNRKLAIEILKNEGTIISEYDFFDKVNKNNFSYRNRIISGLSMSTIIVEARKNSGTLVTANFALDQGRNVCVVPGNITELNYEGSNDLIKEGAEIFNLNML